MNAFAKWIERMGLRPIDVANALGMTRSAVSKMCRAGYWPTRASAELIRRVSGGQVSIDDLIDDAEVHLEETVEHRLAQEAMLSALERRREKEDGKTRSSSKKRRDPQGPGQQEQ